MQEALKNPDFKIIWEEINWQIRHPKAKSLGDALEMELEEELCVGVTELLRCARAGEYYIRDMYTTQQRHPRLTILGRYIMFNDILSLIFTKTRNVSITLIERTGHNLPQLVQIKINDANGLIYFNYILNEALEKQNHKTLKAIAGFIK